MRYGEQIFEIDVPLEGIDLNSPTLIADIEDRFHVRHEELYTYASREQEVVFVNARVAAIGAVAAGEGRLRAAQAAVPCKPRGKRKAFFGAWREVDVYALDDLRTGHAIVGPAIVEAETTTVVINAGDRLTVNALGWLDIQLSKTRG
jgi:N-methylhydantoinase A